MAIEQSLREKARMQGFDLVGGEVKKAPLEKIKGFDCDLVF